ncbi:MAG: sensor histidine kinase [Verrucomicrobia bacterium]|nr:sensor histidine kinase [Verrucomicrobiota bacterium]
MVSGLLQLIRRQQAVIWTLVAGLGLTAALGWELDREAIELDQQRLARRVVEIQSQLDSRLEKSEMLLHNLRDYLTWYGDTSETGFQRWCYENGHTINCRWLAGIALATNRNLPKWPKGIPKTPMSWGSNEWESVRAAAVANAIDCELALTSSLTNTMRFARDYHLRGLPRERTRFANTVGSSRVGMSEHRIVMQDVDGNGVGGTCFLVPLFQSDVNGLIAEVMQGSYTNWGDRATIYWLHFTSVIVAPVDFNFLVWAISEEAPEDVKIELFSSTNQLADTWLNKTGPIPRAADPEFRPYLSHRQRWRMYGRKFSIYFYTTPLFEAQSPRRLAKVAMAAGAGLSVLTTALVGVALRARDRQSDLTDQILEARDALTASQKAREKFSRDLHDGTIQSLYAIQLGPGHLSEKLESDPARARREFSSVRKELDAVIAETRNFISSGEVTSAAVNFKSVLSAIIERAQASNTAQITLECDHTATAQLAAVEAVQLANIAREAISNSLRHAKSTQVQVSLRQDNGGMLLQITDNGTGFDPESPHRFGVGLTSMRSRAHEIGGLFNIESSPNTGTRISVRVPDRASSAS